MFGDYYSNVVRKPYSAKASSRVRNMSATERIFAKAGAKAEDISVAASQAKGMQYDGEKEVEAYEYGLEQRKNGNGQDLELLIEATDYLDSIGESGIMEEGITDIYEKLNAETYSDYKRRVPDASETDYKLYIEIKNTGEFGIIRVPPLQIDISGLEVLNDHAFNHGCTIDDAKKYIASAKCSITRNKWDGKHINYYSLDGAAYLNEDGKVNTIFSKEDFDAKTDKIVGVFR